MVSKRVLIVGGVAGGASCAARLRRMDERAEIVLFERGQHVSFANCGLPYYLGGVIQDRDRLLVATPEKFREWFNVEVQTQHEVRRILRAERAVEVYSFETNRTRTEGYDALVLAPGAAPLRPPLPGIDLPGVFCLRNLEDADQLGAWIDRRGCRRAVVIGAGYIGLEMAENLCRREMHVTVLERLEQVMPQLDPEMVAPLCDELNSRGVDLQLGNGAAGFAPGEGDQLDVLAQDGRRIPADVVVLCAGVKPETKLAEEAGLQIGNLGGIKVDDRMRTSDPNIFAVGDAVEVRHYVTGQPALIPLAGPANRQGRIAADVICGRDARFRGSQGTAVVGAFELTLAITGATEKALRDAGIAYRKTYTHSGHHAGYYPGAETIMLKLLFEPRDGRVLGAQAVGKAGVVKRIDVIAMAIQKGATVFDLEEAELCYAPQYGSAKDPVNMAGFVAGNVLRGDVDLVHWEEWKDRHAADDAMPLVLDVRKPEERASAAVPRTRNLPLGELRSSLGELPRDREIWVHCGVGQRSYYAARILKQNGFQVRNLSGGLKTYNTQRQ